MNSISKDKELNNRIYIIPIIIVTCTIILIGFLIFNGIKNYYYDRMKEESIRLAKNYSLSLAKAAEAEDIINDLLEAKINTALMIASQGEYNNERFKDLAESLDVDEIDYYNAEGVLIISNIDAFFEREDGLWIIEDVHEIRDFLNSGAESFIGGIREDSISGNNFKYGYLRVGTDGCLIQVGVKAERIDNFLGSFGIQYLLDEIFAEGIALRISFIDNDNLIIGSSNKNYLKKSINDKQVLEVINTDKEHGRVIQLNNEEVYEVFVPVTIGNEKMGTLSIVQSFDETKSLITQVSIFGLLALIIIYLSLIYIIITSYQKNKSLMKLAYFDSLTGLPNLQYMKLFLKKEIANQKDKALLLINCSNFKIVNMIFGLDFGDEIIKGLSDKIKELSSENIFPFRFSGDRFGLYIQNYYTRENIVTITEEINEIFKQPFKVKNAEQYLDVKVGIMEFTNNYKNVDYLLRDVLIALNDIKSNEKLNYAFFNEDMDNRIKRQEKIERKIRNVLSNNDNKNLYLEYQPLVDLRTNKIVGFEALARLKSETLGDISPVEFIDIAEKKQLIVPLGNLILEIACNFINNIRNRGFKDIRIAVNVSGIQLLRDDFLYDIKRIMNKSNIDESLLELEITESVLLDNFDLINRKLKRLRDYRIKIALDDFGTGYSSFSRLRDLNIDILKIDRYFVNSLSKVGSKKLMTGSIIQMAHKLDLIVVAEGVEDEEQKRYLIENKCDIMQGFLFSKPLSEADTYKILAENKKS
jgi:diguanylate cyclase (GGDEF)-like protein